MFSKIVIVEVVNTAPKSDSGTLSLESCAPSLLVPHSLEEKKIHPADSRNVLVKLFGWKHSKHCTEKRQRNAFFRELCPEPPVPHSLEEKRFT